MIAAKSRILITGGTGSFGRAFVKRALDSLDPQKLVIFSRDEMKQWEMAKAFGADERVRFFLGDVRDRERLYRAFSDIDFVVHAAATKIVPTAEYNPFEAVKTNVFGAMNVVDAAIDRGVTAVVALSTDKASAPINLYGATKLASDKIFSAANNSYSGQDSTKFSVVRYGNVLGSRGSVIPFFTELRRQGQRLPITDERMTRFAITLDQGLNLVMKAFDTMVGGEVLVHKIPSVRLVDVAGAISPGQERDYVGLRPGEKMHEQMIGAEESHLTLDHGDHFRIYSPETSLADVLEQFPGAKQVPSGFRYASDSNDEWMSAKEIKSWIAVNQALLGSY